MAISTLKKPAADRDTLVVIQDNGTADIATVYDTDDQAIYAESATQDYAVPIADYKAYVGQHGRIYVLRADSDYVRDTERLASLEKSIVLRHVTHYQKPPEAEAAGINLRQILLYAMIGILLLAVIFK